MSTPIRTDIAYAKVYVVCRCGKVYRPGQEEALWSCIREHVDADRLAEEFQRKMDLTEFVKGGR